MNAKFTNIAAALVCALALFSCDIGMSSSDKGSISMRLPDQSQLSGSASADSLDGISRSVSSGGSISAGTVDQFKVVVRNLSSQQTITQIVAPGSSVTIDDLEPGSWDVAIFGYDTAGTSGDPIYYGNARGIPVEGGETSSATVNLYDISGNMPGFGFNGVDPSAAMNIQYAYMAWSCAELGQSGEEFYSCSFTAGGDPNHPELKPPVPVLMEPGYNYKAQVTFYGGIGYPAIYTGSVNGQVPANGGLVEGNVTTLDKEFTPRGTLNGHYVIGNNFADFINSYYSEYDLSSETIQNTDVSYKAVNDKVCGVSVPFIASYGKYSCVVMPSVYHPSPVPSVSVPNQTVQKGQTITVSPSLSPSAPKAWPKLTTDTPVNGFSRYIVDSANSDQDTWTPTLTCSDLSANKVDFNNNDKTLTGKAAGSNNFTWTVTVSAGTYGETPTTPTATANFTATCVEAAQPSGGGSGSVPPAGFVFVQGATISGKIGDGTGANASSVFIDNRTIEIPDMYVCAHEVTQSEYETYCTYAESSPSAYYGVGTDCPVYNVSYYDAIVYCNLRSAAENLDPVYYAVIDGTTDETSLDWTAGTKSYNVDDWMTLDPSYGVMKNSDGKYYVKSAYVNSRKFSYPNRGITMDKTRNGYRLLTEAEWEYCARGGNGLTGTQTYYSGSDTLNAVAWNYGNSKDTTDNNYKSHIVMQLDPNGLGLYDMTGNVEEWVYDWTSSDSVGTIKATTPETGYVYNSTDMSTNTAKGGYWNMSGSSCYVNRHATYGTYRSYEVGFRICKNIDTRTLSGFKGIWSLSPPAQNVAKNTGVVQFFLQNNTASSSDYASFDPSKLQINYGGTTHNFDANTMTLVRKANGVQWEMTNPNTSTGSLWFTFYYDGVEIGYANTFTN